MNPLWQRAYLLYQQDRYDMAEEACRQYLLEEPEDEEGLIMLALILNERDKGEEALQAVRQAIVAAPDNAQAHWVHASILFGLNRADEAGRAVSESLAIDPDQPVAWWLMATIYFQQERWQQSLDAAERGLASDPENERCLNIKALCLNRLGRAGLSQVTLQDALARNPDNGRSHANLGWTRIELGDYRGALDSFREALRLDPELDYARAGMVEAIKGKNWLYRGMLRFTLWLRRMNSQQRWMVIIGLYLGFRAIRQIGTLVPALAPYATLLNFVYMVFALLTWIADPLANLLLRLHPDGKYALSRRQIVEANCEAAVVAAAMGFVIAGFVWQPATLLLAALMVVLLTPVVAGLVQCEPGAPRRNMALVAVGMFLLTAWLMTDLISLGALSKVWLPAFAAATAAAWQGYPLAAVGSQIAATYFASQRVSR